MHAEYKNTSSNQELPFGVDSFSQSLLLTYFNYCNLFQVIQYPRLTKSGCAVLNGHALLVNQVKF